MSLQSAFKAYDVRGRVPGEINEAAARRIGRAFVEQFQPGRVVLGRDVRLSSSALAQAVADGMRTAGTEVLDMGLCGTEEVYFATFHLKTDGGIMVTASHNPPDYNGMKFVRADARPVSADTGLQDIARRVLAKEVATPASARGGYREVNVRDDYVRHVLGYIDVAALKPMKVVVNAGNGCAGPAFDAIAQHLPLKVTRLFHEPDGHFPNGVPNPMLEENRAVTARAVRAEGAALGIAWDGDFDRCFFFDEHGEFIEGYYLVGLLAQAFLAKSRGEKIVHDPRLTWNTLDIVQRAGGTPVLSRCGHAFIKDVMRSANAIYGGEMSAHHYFRDFAYCDSGMIPWLLMLELLSKTGKPLSEMVAERMRLFPVSGEINRKVADSAAAMRKVEARYQAEALNVAHFDGLSMEFSKWRFNLRPSNTEPLLRLNVEARADAPLMCARTQEILQLISG
ncbi:MAG: phosphomannomutase [Gammaproteobacteria bacterium]|nr:phosphomannomutase [Gammaproteobacteria bacterium]MBU6509975.1 phosphomannomutase [Gammaproteobacteria bacterium]MDE2108695.1 phosphomannomutase [Gammaproteobacteria bacterium]MDE2460058.1 phosphomannomutase [Gammaproteobacteria bacterium]